MSLPPDPYRPPLPWAVCSACGAPYERQQAGSLCPDCQAPATLDYDRHTRRRGKTAARGYGGAWQRLSRRARALQPFCTDCGTAHDLTADHSAEAWRRHDAGLSVRLQDVDVVCIRCNSERGAARGENASDYWRPSSAKDSPDRFPAEDS